VLKTRLSGEQITGSSASQMMRGLQPHELLSMPKAKANTRIVLGARDDFYEPESDLPR
jgi:hypothetical protein